jgi:hypothetical protein
MKASEFFAKMFPPIDLPFELKQVRRMEARVELTSNITILIVVDRKPDESANLN